MTLSLPDALTTIHQCTTLCRRRRESHSLSIYLADWLAGLFLRNFGNLLSACVVIFAPLGRLLAPYTLYQCSERGCSLSVSTAAFTCCAYVLRKAAAQVTATATTTPPTTTSAAEAKPPQRPTSYCAWFHSKPPERAIAGRLSQGIHAKLKLRRKLLRLTDASKSRLLLLVARAPTLRSYLQSAPPLPTVCQPTSGLGGIGGRALTMAIPRKSAADWWPC